MKRRDFIKSSSALMLTSALGRMSFASSSDSASLGTLLGGYNDTSNSTFQIVALNLETGKLHTCPVNFISHSVIASDGQKGFYAGTEKRGKNLAIVDAKSFTKVAQIAAPDGKVFYGHACFNTGADRLYVSTIDDTKPTTDKPIYSEGYVTVIDMNRRKIETVYSSYGNSCHDVKYAKKTEQIIIANHGTATEASSVVSINPQNGSKLSEIKISKSSADTKTDVSHFTFINDHSLLMQSNEWPRRQPDNGRVLRCDLEKKSFQFFDMPKAEQVHMNKELLSVATCSSRSLGAVTCPESRSVFIFNTDSGQHLKTLHTYWPTGVSVSLDQTMFIVTTLDGIRFIKTNDLSWQEPLTTLPRFSSRPFRFIRHTEIV